MKMEKKSEDVDHGIVYDKLELYNTDLLVE